MKPRVIDFVGRDPLEEHVIITRYGNKLPQRHRRGLEPVDGVAVVDGIEGFDGLLGGVGTRGVRVLYIDVGNVLGSAGVHREIPHGGRIAGCQGQVTSGNTFQRYGSLNSLGRTGFKGEGAGCGDRLGEMVKGGRAVNGLVVPIQGYRPGVVAKRAAGVVEIAGDAYRSACGRKAPVTYGERSVDGDGAGSGSEHAANKGNTTIVLTSKPKNSALFTE